MPSSIEDSIILASRAMCLSAEEQKLYNHIIKYRKENKLKPIQLSSDLTEVAKIHAKDLHENHAFGETDCNMHSWSEKGNWTACCYTADHKDPNCMWDKPKELTGYAGQGYEISYYYSKGVTADDAIDGWKKSAAHNEVMINKGIWKQAEWNAIGVGIYETYATVWFGMVEDSNKPGNCP